MKHHIHLAIICLSATCALVLPARAVTYRWVGQVDDQWDTAPSGPYINWTPVGPIPGSGDTVSFDFIPASNPSLELGANRTVNSVQFGALGTDHNIKSGGGGDTPYALTLTSGIIMVAPGVTMHKISSGVTLGNTGNWNIGSNAVFEVSGIVSGGFGLNKSGGGTLKLTGNNSYTGDTEISEGTLIATGADERLPNGTAVRIDPGAALRIDGITESIDGLRNFAGSLFLDNDATLQVAPSTSRSFPGTITGASGTTIAVTGGVRQRLLAANPDFFGTARVSGGELRLAHADALQNATVDIQEDDGLNVTTSAIDANIGALTGTGALSLGSQILVTGLNNTSSSYSGTLSGDSNSRLRHNGTGTLTLTGGSEATPSALGQLHSEHADGAIVLDGARIDIGTASTNAALLANEGDITLQGGADVQLTEVGWAIVRAGILTVNGADTSLLARLVALSNEASGPGSLVVENAGEVTINNVLGVGLDGDADLTLRSGGTVATTTLFIGDQASGDALVTGTGSRLTANKMSLGGQATSQYGGTGTLTVKNGGAIEISDTTEFFTFTSSITIDGGTLETGKLEDPIAGATGSISLSDPVGGTALTVGSSNGNSTFDGLIKDLSGKSGSLKKVGTGTFTLTGANTHTGGTTLSDGTLVLADDDAAGTGPITLLGGTLDIADTVTLGNAINLQDSASLNVGSGSATLTGTISLTGAPFTTSLTKSGSGSLTLSSASTYNGSTIVDDGTLLANNSSGSATGTGTVQVNSGAVLGGSGKVDGAAILAGATIAPGDNSIDTLKVGASLSISGTYRCELANSSADRLVVSAFLTLGAGSVIDFDETAPPAGATLIVARYGARIGTFGSVTGLPADYMLVYDYDDGSSSNNIALVPLTSYDTWAVFKGLTLGDNDGFNDDPNNDGRPNSLHFAFDTDPLGNGTDGGKTRISLEEIEGTDYLTLTLPIRSGATFAGAPLASDPIDGLIYSILGDTDLQAPWDLTLVEVVPALDSSLPALGDYDGVAGADWEYRTFRLTNPFSTLQQAFLRASVQTTP